MKQILKCILCLIALFFFYSNYFGQNKTIDSLKNALKNAKYDTTKVRLRQVIGETGSLFRIGYWDSLAIDAKKFSYKLIEAISYNNLGFIYNDKGDILKALEYHHKSLSIREKMFDKQGIGLSLNNLGYLYCNQGDTSKALEYYTKSLKFRTEIKDSSGIAHSLNNIGLIYANQGESVKALNCFIKSQQINEIIEDKDGLATSLNNVGFVYSSTGELKMALEYFNKSLTIRDEIGDKRGIANSLDNIARLMLNNNQLEQAYLYAKRSYVTALELGYPENIRNASKTLKLIFKLQNNYKEAFEMYEVEMKMRDSINNVETQKQSVKREMQYAQDKKELEIKAEQGKKDIIVKGELKQKERERNYFIAGFGIVLLLALFILRGYKQKQNANEIITQQKKLVEEKQKELIDSIHYARRIQTALLPNEKYIEKTLNKLNKSL